jgi:capsular exopolysaccharide synthesis family protein
MENDQRLTPLPIQKDLQPAHIEYASAYSSMYDDTLASKRSLRQYFNIVYKRLPIIVAITILATAAAAFYSFRQPSIYEAHSSMIIEPRKAPQQQKDAININFGEDEKYYNTQLELLKNQDLMKRVVISLGLHREPNVFGEQNRGLWAGIKSLFSGGQKQETADNSLPIVSETSADNSKSGQIQLTPEENSRAELYSGILDSGLSVEQKDRTNIVDITLRSSNPGVAARAADRVAELFIKEDADRETAGAQKAYEDLGASIEELKGTIAQQENELIEQMRSVDVPTIEGGSGLRTDNLKMLQSQVNDAWLDVQKLQSTYDAALQASKTGDILSIVPENFKGIQAAKAANLSRKLEFEKRRDELRKRIDEREQRRQELLAKYTEEHPMVKQVAAEIVELNNQLTRLEQEITQKVTAEDEKLEKDSEREILATLQSELTAAQQRLSRAIQKFDEARSRANVEGQQEIKLTTLNDALKNNRELLNTYTQRQKEQELALSSGRPNNISVQNHAITPTTPIGPQRGRNILVALLLSFAAGIGLAFLLDYLDDSVRTSDDISRHLGLPTLALIPHYLTTDKRKLLSPVNGNGASSSSAMITLDDRHSPMAEAYRHLRTSLLFSSAGKPPQTILVTSSQPSEGKTTTAINTAITLAQSDADVIIIDCDLRRPRLHSHFGFENTRGLTNYLSGDKNTEDLVRTYPDLPRLKVITSGPIPPNPAELLSSNEMRNLLQFLSGKFKHVIIDSPPAISFTDAAILSTLVDGVILVAMANKSSIHLMRQFKQRVHNIGARIYGVVLNGIKSGSMEYDYYGSGYYHYYSKNGDDESTPYMEEQERSNVEAAGK